MMQLIRALVVRKLDAYLHHQLTLDDLVVWANEAMREGDFEEEHFDARGCLRSQLLVLNVTVRAIRRSIKRHIAAYINASLVAGRYS